MCLHVRDGVLKQGVYLLYLNGLTTNGLRSSTSFMVRKTLSFSKEEEMLRAFCVLEDVVYNLARPLKSLRLEVDNDQRRWGPRSPAMAAGITDHIWTIGEIMMMLAVPERNNA
jgi:hypothetical protein